MDDRHEPPQLTFGPDRRLTIAAAVGAATAVFVAVLTDDRQACLLAALVAAILAGFAACDIVFSPRLTLSRDGVVVRSPFARARLAWDEVDEVRADERLRMGVRSVALEVDAGDMLAVLSRRALNADPREVAALAASLRG